MNVMLLKPKFSVCMSCMHVCILILVLVVFIILLLDRWSTDVVNFAVSYSVAYYGVITQRAARKSA